MKYLTLVALLFLPCCLTHRVELHRFDGPPVMYYIEDAYYHGAPLPGAVPVERHTICESPVRLPADATVTKKCN